MIPGKNYYYYWLDDHVTIWRKFHEQAFFRTTFSAEGTTTKQTTTQLQFQKEQCFFGAENIQKVPGFNPSANEKPLEFNVSARSVDENQIFDGKLGVLDIRKSLSKMEKVPFNTGKYMYNVHLPIIIQL